MGLETGVDEPRGRRRDRERGLSEVEGRGEMCKDLRRGRERASITFLDLDNIRVLSITHRPTVYSYFRVSFFFFFCLSFFLSFPSFFSPGEKESRSFHGIHFVVSLLNIVLNINNPSLFRVLYFLLN